MRAMKVNSQPENEVVKLIAKTDDYRARYYKYYTGKEWKDALNYDLSLDSSGWASTVLWRQYWPTLRYVRNSIRRCRDNGNF